MAKNKYTLEDLEWMETFLREVKGYVDNNPLSALEDRTEVVMSAKGTPVIKVIAKKEDQLKALLFMLREALQMLSEVDRLREEQASKDIEIRGGGQVNGMMQYKLTKKDEDDETKNQDNDGIPPETGS